MKSPGDFIHTHTFQKNCVIATGNFSFLYTVHFRKVNRLKAVYFNELSLLFLKTSRSVSFSKGTFSVCDEEDETGLLTNLHLYYTVNSLSTRTPRL